MTIGFYTTKKLPLFLERQFFSLKFWIKPNLYLVLFSTKQPIREQERLKSEHLSNILTFHNEKLGSIKVILFLYKKIYLCKQRVRQKIHI